MSSNMDYLKYPAIVTDENLLYRCFYMDHQQAGPISKTVSHYASNNWKEQWQYICFRIKEFVLSIFGQSDWQTSRKLMREHVLANKYKEFDLTRVKTNSQIDYLADQILLGIVKTCESFPKSYYFNSSDYFNSELKSTSWFKEKTAENVRIAGENFKYKFGNENPVIGFQKKN